MSLAPEALFCAHRFSISLVDHEICGDRTLDADSRDSGAESRADLRRNHFFKIAEAPRESPQNGQRAGSCAETHGRKERASPGLATAVHEALRDGKRCSTLTELVQRCSFPGLSVRETGQQGSRGTSYRRDGFRAGEELSAPGVIEWPAEAPVARPGATADLPEPRIEHLRTACRERRLAYAYTCLRRAHGPPGWTHPSGSR